MLSKFWDWLMANTIETWDVERDPEWERDNEYDGWSGR